MTEFLSIIVSFPTAVFTGLMVVVVLYWIMVILGLFHLGGEGAAEGIGEGVGEGAAEGIGEGVGEGLAEGVGEGLAEGVGEGLAEGVGEGAGEGLAEGAGEGAGEGLGEGAAEGAHHADVHAAEGASAMASLLHAIGFKKAPVTVIVSLVIFFTWTLLILGTKLLGAALGARVPLWLLNTLLIVGAMLLAFFLTSLFSRPLGRLFVWQRAPQRASTVGKVCTIATGRVDLDFGQATVEDGGAGLLVQVRCMTRNQLKRGDRALVLSYDDEREAFLVEPYDPS